MEAHYVVESPAEHQDMCINKASMALNEGWTELREKFSNFDKSPPRGIQLRSEMFRVQRLDFKLTFNCIIASYSSSNPKLSFICDTADSSHFYVHLYPGVGANLNVSLLKLFICSHLNDRKLAWFILVI